MTTTPAGPVAAVLVDTGLAHLDRSFEYAIPAELDDQVVPGCRVAVRFAGRDRPGYVVERRAVPEHGGRLTPIRAVRSPEAVLTTAILAVATEIAGRYAGTVGDVLRLAVPPRHARAEAALDAKGDPPTAPAPAPATADAADAVWAAYPAGAALLAHLRSGGSPGASWAVAPVAGPAGSWPAGLAAAVAATSASGRGSIVVVPDARDVRRVSAAIEERLGPDAHVVLTADQGPQARYTAWLKVLRGHVRVAVGARAAAFAPVADLGLVAWWDDGDDLHAEPRAPYPHVREVLLARARAEGAAVLAAGLTVTTDVARLVHSGVLRPVDHPDGRGSAAPVRVAGEGHDAERDGPAARAHLPGAAWRAAKEAISRGPVLVQVPRRGYVPSVACAACRVPARCARCGGPLAIPAPGAVPACRWCAQAAPSHRCTACGADALRATVVGARRTAEELGRAFPGVPVITSGAGEVRATVLDEPALVIATPGAEPVADGGYAATLLLDAWALLDRPDLRAAEEALRRWTAAQALTRGREAGGQVVLCGAPTHVTLPAVEALVRVAPRWFAERELAERAELGLTPAAWGAVVTGPDDALARHAAMLTQGLDPAAGVTVLGPLPGDPARLLLQAPWSAAPVMVDRLAAIRRREAADKVAHPVRVVVEPPSGTA